MAKVELKGISKVYDGGVRAVDNANITVEDKEFVVFVGPSGCGKSTTLRRVAGLEDITEGELLIDGELMNDVPPKDRNIAMVFQNYALYPHMTVFENLAFGLKLAGTPKAEVTQRVRHAAGLLEMEHLLERYPKQLSGGQAQRVAVGRAIVKKPEVFLFDEPLSNLDAKLRAAMRVRLTELHRTLRETGQPATVVYVTHDQVEAMTMGERICVLKDGVIQQVDTPTALYDRPANAFVASFIGSPEMNIVNAQLKPGDNGVTVELGGQVLRLPASRAAQLNSGSGAVQFGLRPEHVSAGPRPQGDSVPVEGTLRFAEHMGSEVFVHFTVGDNAMSARVPADELHGLQDKARGAAHVFHFQMQRAHLFEAQSGVSLLRCP